MYKDRKDPRNAASKRKYYDKNRGMYRQRNRDRKDRLVAMVRQIKSVPCADCGKTFPFFIMEFDHRAGEIKLFDIGIGVAQAVSRMRLLAEIAKCDVVCCLCHRYRTARRAGWIAGEPGLEPGVAEPESAVLPDYTTPHQESLFG